MLTYCGKSSLFIQHFRCITSDITSNKHLPNNEGYLSCDNGKYHLENGDELAIMDGTQDVYLFDEEHQVWIMQ